MKAIFALLLLTLPAHASAQGGAASQADRYIEAQVRDSYVYQNYLRDDDIKVTAADGAVTLTGIISGDFYRSLAQVTAADVPGVRSVDNRLELKGSLPSANSDAWFREKVKAALRFRRSTGAGTTEVDVMDGIVTLRGVAATQAQKDLAGEYAGNIEGVKGLSNEMTVAPAPKPKPRSTAEKVDDISVSALVRMALQLHRSTSGLQVAVATKLGVVTVGGRAASAAEKELVTKLIRDVNGVKRVKNRMTVGKP
jgi:osmotically-inducible protein OsmY